MALNAKKWYVLHVVSGKEQDIGEQLLSKGIESFVPIENRVIRQRGKWIQKPYAVFKGYVFVHIHYTWPLFYEIGKIKNVYRMLGSLDEDRSEGGTKKGSEVFVPVPLSREEEKRLFKECRLLAEPPVVRLKEDGECIVVSKGFRRMKVKKIDRHARRITFLTTIAGKKTEFTVSFIEADEAQTLNDGTG